MLVHESWYDFMLVILLDCQQLLPLILLHHDLVLTLMTFQVKLSLLCSFIQVLSVDLNSRHDCLRKFKSNTHIGAILLLAIVAGSYVKSSQS